MSSMLSLPEYPHAQPTRDSDPSCPFCAIVATYPPISPLRAVNNPILDPFRLEPEAFVLFSGEHVVAFLDIGPLTRGHTLISPRKHRVKLGELTPEESAEIGQLLPMLSKAVIRATLPDIPFQHADYNVVQNNGPGAAQVVPHVHFHIVPRPPQGYLVQPPDYVAPDSDDSEEYIAAGTGRRRRNGRWNYYPPNPMPTGMKATAILFGRGQRHYRDDDEAVWLVQKMREEVRREWVKLGWGEDEDTNGRKRSGGKTRQRNGDAHGDGDVEMTETNTSREDWNRNGETRSTRSKSRGRGTPAPEGRGPGKL